MSDYWDNLASRADGVYAVEDFEAAAYRLVAEQIIYYTDLRSRAAYSIIDLYEREFGKVLAPLGISLLVNRQHRYVAAIPRHSRATTATVQQTLFALVMRGIYEESARAGNLSDEGEVFCDFVELQEKYRLMTGRELPGRGEIDGLLRTTKRWGIARRLDDTDTGPRIPGADDTASGIAIRPGIVDVLGEAALQRIALWQSAEKEAVAMPAGETSEEISDEAV